MHNNPCAYEAYGKDKIHKRQEKHMQEEYN